MPDIAIPARQFFVKWPAMGEYLVVGYGGPKDCAAANSFSPLAIGGSLILVGGTDFDSFAVIQDVELRERDMRP